MSCRNRQQSWLEQAERGELMSRGRNAKGRFEKGCSGNPTGRPKRTDVERETIESICLLAPKAVDALKNLLESEETPANIKIKAVDIILERVCGKALDAKELDEYDFTSENIPRIIIDV